jgi:hypothetical protein
MMPVATSIIITLLLLEVFAACARSPSLLHPHLLPSIGDIYFQDDVHKDSSGHWRKFSATSAESLAISNWIDAHQTGWTFMFAPPERPSFFEPQEKVTISSDIYDIALCGTFIRLNYLRKRGDDWDGAIMIMRAFSNEDQQFWNSLVSKIRTTYPPAYR